MTVTANSQTKVYGTADPALPQLMPPAPSDHTPPRPPPAHAPLPPPPSSLTPLTITPPLPTRTDDPPIPGFVDAAVDGVLIDDTAATVLSGGLARTPGETVSGGPYAITHGTLAADSNYTLSFTGSTLSITPAPLTVTANSQTKLYGTADPDLTDTATGFVDCTLDGVLIDDTAATVLSGGLARTPGETVSGGPYAITQGTLAADSNYTLSFTGSTLTITPAPLTVTANSQTKVYGTADPALTETPIGFVDATVDGVTIDDTAATVLSGQLARTPGETVSGGPYAITQGTLAANSNYTIDFTGSALSITPATPAVSVTSPGGAFTGSPIAAQATVTGSSGTAAASLEGVTPTLIYYVGSGTSATSLGSIPPVHPGTYTVVASFPGSADYAMTQSLPKTFTIDKAASRVALVPSVEASVFGQTVTLSAGPFFGAAVPGGSVTFYDGSTALGTAAVNASGKAVLTTAALSVGTHSLTAAYGGDADFAAGVSGASALSVAQAATEVVLVPEPVFKNRRNLVALRLKAVVQPTGPGNGVPSGIVTFEIQKKVGRRLTEKVLGTVALGGGSATLSVKPTSMLDHPITILYGGDSDFTPSAVSPSRLTQKGLQSSYR